MVQIRALVRRPKAEPRTNHHTRYSEGEGVGLDCLSINPKRARMGSLWVLDCRLYILHYTRAARGYLQGYVLCMTSQWSQGLGYMMSGVAAHTAQGTGRDYCRIRHADKILHTTRCNLITDQIRKRKPIRYIAVECFYKENPSAPRKLRMAQTDFDSLFKPVPENLTVCNTQFCSLESCS